MIRRMTMSLIPYGIISGADGKTQGAKDSGRVNFKTIVRADGATKKYTFDEEGKMLYGSDR